MAPINPRFGSPYDPHKVITEAHALKVMFGAQDAPPTAKFSHKHFLLEHIISGAMAAGIPARAKRYAFSRDKADGVARGVQAADVVRAVNDLFQENKGLEHAFALQEFQRDFMAEVQAEGDDQ